MNKKLFLSLIILLIAFIIAPSFVNAQEQTEISYCAHVQQIGWQECLEEGNYAGTTGLGKRLEAIKINIDSNYSGNVEYSTHIQQIGWTNFVSGGEISGTVGEGKRMEAIRIKLTGELAEKYDIYYQTHVSQIGWLDWTKNGEKSGSIGYGYRIEAIRILLVTKGGQAPGSTNNYYVEKPVSIQYSSHIQQIGWQTYANDGALSGTTGQGKRLEAIKIKTNHKGNLGNINYRVYVEDIGWQNYVYDDSISGTTGLGKKIEAIEINLTGELNEKYDIYYQVHVSQLGWLDWTKNGEPAGAIGYGYRMESIKIILVSKGANSPGSTSKPYYENELILDYSSHVQQIGWQDSVISGQTSGTTGQGKRIEAFKLDTNLKFDNSSILYNSYIQGSGWQDYVGNGQISGTVGEGKRIEAIRIKLTGEFAEKYDIYYRVHVQQVGWLDWAKNDEIAGTINASLRVEAMEITVVKKGDNPPGNIGTSYMEAKWVTDNSGNKYYYDIYGELATGSKQIGNTIYYFGPTGIYLGNNKLKILDVSYHQGSIDWNKVASSGIYGVILRIGYWNTEDARFSEYISEVKRLNIPYGIYLFGYASTTSGAQTEANFTNSMISKYNLNPTLGIYYDVEDWYVAPDNNSGILSKNDYDNITRTYLNSVRSYVGGKYNVKIYANLNYANNRFNDYARSEIDWIAHYNSTCGYNGSYSMWQYTSSAQINGVNGYVDMSYLYK